MQVMTSRIVGLSLLAALAVALPALSTGVRGASQSDDVSLRAQFGAARAGHRSSPRPLGFRRARKCSSSMTDR